MATIRDAGGTKIDQTFAADMVERIERLEVLAAEHERQLAGLVEFVEVTARTLQRHRAALEQVVAALRPDSPKPKAKPN